MTHSQPRTAANESQPLPNRTTRLRLKPGALPTGYVDGAWWPRSVDLVAELPDLLALLKARLREISYLAYHPGEWAMTPASIIVGDRVVRLTRSRRQPRNTLEILGQSGTGIILLVVPPDAELGQASDIMSAASAPGDRSTTTGLLFSWRGYC